MSASLFSGLMISGDYNSFNVGKSVEVFLPSSSAGQHCELPDLPARRWSHSMAGKTVCGGGEYSSDSLTSCFSLSDGGTWERTTDLLESR